MRFVDIVAPVKVAVGIGSKETAGLGPALSRAWLRRKTAEVSGLSLGAVCRRAGKNVGALGGDARLEHSELLLTLYPAGAPA